MRTAQQLYEEYLNKHGFSVVENIIPELMQEHADEYAKAVIEWCSKHLIGTEEGNDEVPAGMHTFESWGSPSGWFTTEEVLAEFKKEHNL